MRLLTDGPFRGCWRHGYQVIYLDPPWRYETWGEVNGKAPPYPTMSEAELLALPVNDICAMDSWMFMWSSPPFLAQSIALMKAYGFRYSTIAYTWVKLNADGSVWRATGKTTRKSTEIVLLGRLGNPKIWDKNTSELIETIETPKTEILRHKRGEHSVKPNEARERIDQMVGSDMKRIELFARRNDTDVSVPWHYWGNQTTLYNDTPIL